MAGTRTVERRIPGLVVVEREHSLPLDHAQPGGERLTVFSREIADPDGRERPLLVYLEGGPGHETPRPARGDQPAWLERALADFRVLMLDQRGTGRSSPIGPSLAEGRTPQELADRLALFRADSIVADAEAIRQELDVDRWSLLGQSFGGFCAVTYLSRAPEALREVLITGGVPPLGMHIDEVYRATYRRMVARSERYYQRYPQDRERLLSLRARLAAEPIRLPDGDPLDPERLRESGQVLGMSDGAERLHYLLELEWDSPAFLHDIQAVDPFARNPLYAIVHEACWADTGSTRWSAARMLEEGPPLADEHFTGEHIFPHMFERRAALRPFADAMQLLASREWPALYDEQQLKANEVPVAGLICAEDCYVEAEFSLQTAARIGGMRHWLTNEYDHDGLRKDSERVLGRLLDMARGRI